jgi:hypothetical protein
LRLKVGPGSRGGDTDILLEGAVVGSVSYRHDDT